MSRFHCRHLSWRAAIVLYRQWRNMGIGRTQLKTMIKDLCQVPDTIISKETIDRGTHSTTNVFKLISPSGMLSFYCYLEQKMESEPHGSSVFESSGLSYRAVMNLMEQGLYVPRGEANELLDHLKSDYIVKVSGSGQASRHARYEHRVIWDHKVFSQVPKIK